MVQCLDWRRKKKQENQIVSILGDASPNTTETCVTVPFELAKVQL